MNATATAGAGKKRSACGSRDPDTVRFTAGGLPSLYERADKPAGVGGIDLHSRERFRDQKCPEEGTCQDGDGKSLRQQQDRDSGSDPEEEV